VSYASDRLDRQIFETGAREAYHVDAEFRATMVLMRTLLNIVEQAMHDEDVEDAVIESVLDKVIYGAISPGELARVEQAQAIFQREFERVSGLELPRPLFPTTKEPSLDPTTERPPGQTGRDH
jgi:hypothetical protein